MFTYLDVKNFRSLGNMTFDFTDRNGEPKNVIVIYGENGVGKTNLLSAYEMLNESFETLDRKEFLEKLANDMENFDEDDFVWESIKSHIRDIKAIIHTNKMADTTENMSLEYGFILDGKNGRYIIETNDEEIVYEKLEYVLTTRKSVFFEFSKEKAHLNSKVFTDKDSNKTLLNEVKKYWGKHSFFAILKHELNSKNEEYYKNSIAENMFNILKLLSGFSFKVYYGSTSVEHKTRIGLHGVGDLSKGVISAKHETDLDKYEKLINAFLCKTIKSVEHAYYKRKECKKGIKYQLVLKKRIQGELRTIDFDMESTGTTNLVNLLPYFMHVCNGGIAFIDEFDLSVHEVLSKQLLKALYKATSGQLVVTSHNSQLMDKSIPRNCFYAMRIEEDGTKTAKCMLEYNNKIGDNNKMQNVYFGTVLKANDDELPFDFKSLVVDGEY